MNDQAEWIHPTKSPRATLSGTIVKGYAKISLITRLSSTPVIFWSSPLKG